jgi:chemotaxis protein MotB
MKKHKHPEHENLERWLVSYADFITLLFAFFTVMYALSLSDKAKYKQTAENIQRSFLSGGGIFPIHGSPFVPFEKPPDRGSEMPPSPRDAGKYSEQEILENVAARVQGLFEKTTGGPAEEINAMKTDQGYKIRLGEVVLFRQGSDKIRPESIPFLYELGKRLGKLKLTLQVEGHSDNDNSAKQTNWQLSMNRAYNIFQFLLTATDYPPNKISLAAYGDTEPVASNETAEGRAKNRRVEIAIISPDREIATLPW